MNKTTILVIGNEDTVQTVVQQINSNNQWEGIGAASDEDAVEKFHRYHIDMALFTNGIDGASAKKLSTLFLFQRPDLMIQYGDDDGSGLQTAITAALEKKKRECRPTISFKDDALKNAALKINLQ